MAAQRLKCVTVLVAVLLSLSPQGTQTQAPGDEHDGCVRGTYNKGVKPLMDTRNYEQLLGVDKAVWYATDFDDNNNNHIFGDVTSWRQGAGGVCRWSIQSCGYRVGRQDNWAITQYIDKTAPQGTDPNVEICVNMTHAISNCRERFGCNPNLEVYKYVTNSPKTTADLNNKDNFERIYKHRARVAFTVYDHFCFDLTEEQRGFYLAIRDQTSCIHISNMLVYRHECATKQVGLVHFPDTASATSGTRTVSAQCVENAEQSSSSLDVHCRSDGIWTSVVPQCRCKPGYREISDKGVKRCIACRRGTYRSSTDPVTTCLPCPANTARDEEGAAECKCLTGYYRNTADLSQQCPTGQRAEGPRVKCTQPPSPPLKLTPSPTDDTISLRWNIPASNGGRPDTYFTVEYSDPNTVGKFLNPTSGTCLTDTEYEITGLLPATDYLVRVTAHNGVSDQITERAFSRITVRTANAPPSAPIGVKGLCGVVVWRKPSRPNGEITAYDLKFFHLNKPSSAITRRLADDATHYVIGGNDDPSGSGTVYVKVRAINEAGVGVYSEAVPVVCERGAGTPVECPSQQPAPETSPPISPPGVVTEIEVLGCGIVAWRTPANTGNEEPGYAIRFFDGDSYDDSSYREIQRFFDDPSVHWARAKNMPSTRPIYADIRAGNSGGRGDFSQRLVVADSRLCSSTAAAPTTTQPPPTCPKPDCPTQETPQCPTAPACDSCCPSCPETPSCASPTTTDSTSTRPGPVRNVRALNCTTIVWEAPEENIGEKLEYRIRLYSGRSYLLTSRSDRLVLSTNDLWIIPDRLPTQRPVSAIVKARNSDGKFSPIWSAPVILVDDGLCPCPK